MFGEFTSSANDRARPFRLIAPAPQRPENPQPGSPRGGCLGFVLALSLLVVALAVLSLLTGGLFLYVAIAAGVVLAIALLHYFIWGWWLGGMIRREVEAEQRDELDHP